MPAAEYQCLVDVMEKVNLGLSSLEPHLELILDSPHISEVGYG